MITTITARAIAAAETTHTRPMSALRTTSEFGSVIELFFIIACSIGAGVGAYIAI